MRKAIMTLAVLACLAAVSARGAGAEWEHVGRIVQEDGRALTGAMTLEVRLYGGATNGAAFLWGRKAPAQLDGNGNYSVLLGDALETLDGAPTNSLEAALAAGPVWAEATVEGNPKAMSPRAAVAPSPYALFAAGAEGAEGDFDTAKDLTVAGNAAVTGFQAESADVRGNLHVGGKLTVKGDLTAGGGISVPPPTSMLLVPVGTIILFCGTEIPSGWALCDGTTANGITTPDLRGRFVVGASALGGTTTNYPPCSTGGLEQVALTVEDLPQHSHLIASAAPAGYGGSGDVISVYEGQQANTTGAIGPGDKQPDGGYGQPHNNLPPFVALDYIMRVE